MRRKAFPQYRSLRKGSYFHKIFSRVVGLLGFLDCSSVVVCFSNFSSFFVSYNLFVFVSMFSVCALRVDFAAGLG